ncbi:PIPO, partial [Turnip mosaic virus]
KKLSTNLGRSMERVKLVGALCYKILLVKASNLYTERFANEKRSRFRRQIQRVSHVILRTE